MDPIAVHFGQEACRSDLDGLIKMEFYEWLCEHVGFGSSIPSRTITETHQWAVMTPSRRSTSSGVTILFRDPRRATMAKMTWGGRI